MNWKIKKHCLLLASAFVVGISGSSAFAQVAEYFSVPVKIERHVSGNSTLLAKDYFHNFAHYTGFRLVAVDVIAGADSAEGAIVKLADNQSSFGPLIELSKKVQNYRVVLTKGLVIGFGAENLALDVQGSAYVRELNLILTR